MNTAIREIPARPQHWTQISERGSVLALRLIFFIYRILGRRICRALLYPIAAYFFCFARTARSASAQYFTYLAETAHSRGADTPKPGPRAFFYQLLSFAQCLVDKIAAWRGELTLKDTRWNNREALRGHLDKGKGAVVLSAHFGNPEVCRAIGEGLPRLKINVLMYLRHARRFVGLLEKSNPHSLVSVIPVDDISPNLVLSLQEKIAHGELVGILADRVTAGSPERAIECTFLGHRARFPEGPFILASLLHCPVFLLFSFAEGDAQYQIFIEQFADRIELRRGHRSEDLLRYASQFSERLEHFSLRYPYQWYNFYQFWESIEPEAAKRIE